MTLISQSSAGSRHRDEDSETDAAPAKRPRISRDDSSMAGGDVLGGGSQRTDHGSDAGAGHAAHGGSGASGHGTGPDEGGDVRGTGGVGDVRGTGGVGDVRGTGGFGGGSQDFMLLGDDSDNEESGNIPKSLVDKPFPLDTFNPVGAMHVTAEHASKMSACSRCFSVKESEHPCSGTHGYPICFMGRMTVTEPSDHFNDALLFGLRLSQHINNLGLQGFVVKTDDLTLSTDSSGKKIIGIFQESAVSLQTSASTATGGFSMRDIFDTRKGDSKCKRVSVDPLKIEVAYTGCEFEVPDEDGGVRKVREAWGMVILTPARNFNLEGMMHKSFFVASNPNGPGIQERLAFANDNQDIWVKLLQYEASENCGFSRDDGNPADSLGDPSAHMGKHALTNIFMTPLKVHASTIKRFPNATNISIIGCPQLFWKHCDQTSNFVSYMNEYMSEWGNHQSALEAAIMESSVKEDKKQGVDGGVGRHKTMVPYAGGWPMGNTPSDNVDDVDVVVGHVRIPRMPIVADFRMRINSQTVTKIALLANGGAEQPALVLYLIREFLNRTEEGDSAISEFEARTLLHDQRPRTHLDEMNLWMGPNVDPLQGLARPGNLRLWLEGLASLLKIQRTNHGMTVESAAKMIDNHLKGASATHLAACSGGKYHSMRVEQGAQIIKNLEESPLWKVDLGKVFKDFNSKMPAASRPDGGSRNLSFLLAVISNRNQSMKLNSINLATWIQLLISNMGWMSGKDNQTWMWFMQLTSLQGNRGHDQIDLSDKGGTVEISHNVKANGKGADFIAQLANTLFEEIGRIFGIDDSKNAQTFINASKWTPGAIEDQCSVQVVNGVIVGMPDKAVKDRPITANEMGRGGTMLGPLISNVCPRDGRGDGLALSTQDPNKDNNRKIAVKIGFSKIHVCTVASNVQDGTIAQGEERRTLNAVTHICVPGVGPYHPLGGVSAQLNNVSCDQFAGLPCAAVDQERNHIQCLTLGVSHIVAGIAVANLNRTGAVLFEIPPSIQAILKWMQFYMAKALKPVMANDCEGNLARYFNGYDARNLYFNMWLQTMTAMTKNQSIDAVILEANKRMMLCALPPQQVCKFVLYVLGFLQLTHYFCEFMSRLS